MTTPLLELPLVPTHLVNYADTPDQEIFEPSVETLTWLWDAFIFGPAATVNPDHVHLLDAQIGVLWTNALNIKAGKVVGGTAEMPRTQGDMWKKGRFAQQHRHFFGYEPDFIITLCAPIAAGMDIVSFCALVEHELYHCGQKIDRWGDPKFSKATGLPELFLRGHDVEEFTPIAARYGIQACAGDSVNFVKAANSPPLFGIAELNCACGACGR